MGKYSRLSPYRQQNSLVLTVDSLATPLVSVSIGAWLPRVKDTSLQRTKSLVPMVSALEGFHCSTLGYTYSHRYPSFRWSAYCACAVGSSVADQLALIDPLIVIDYFAHTCILSGSLEENSRECRRHTHV